MQLHKLTESLYEGLTELFDDIAEKVAMQNETPLSTLKAYIENSTIKEIEPKSFSDIEVIDIIVKDLDTLESIASEVEGTNVVQPLLDEVYLFIDKQRWLFRSHKSK